MTRHDDGFPVFSILYNIVAIPYNFLIGFLVGLAAPVAAIAGIVAGVRLLTGKVPFVLQAEGEGGERNLTLKLVPQEEVGELFAEEKERISEELSSFQAEIKSIIEQARAEGAKAAQAETGPDTIEIPVEG